MANSKSDRAVNKFGFKCGDSDLQQQHEQAQRRRVPNHSKTTGFYSLKLGSKNRAIHCVNGQGPSLIEMWSFYDLADCLGSATQTRAVLPRS